MSKVVELKQRGSRASLREAMGSRTLIRLWREDREAASFSGYVAGMGREFFLFWTVGDYIGFDGLYALRYRDVSSIEAPDKSAGFLEKALALRQITPSWPAEFRLDDVESVITDAAREAPVVGVHVDSEGDDEVCYIGRLLGFEGDGFLIQEISPDAQWMGEPSSFGFEEVSAIGFASPYHSMLAEVAGTPPQGLRAFSRDRGGLS